MLSPEQVEKTKGQLIQHISENFPDEKKEFAINQIENMDSEQLENFLKKNNLVKSVQEPHGCVFCSIVHGQIESHQIAETKDALAVLEINPVTRGHALIIPKEHHPSSDKVPSQIFSFAKDIAKSLKSKLKPKPENITISSSNLFGHEIVNVIPIYQEGEPKERHKTNPEELKELQSLLKKSKPSPRPRTKTNKSLKNIRIPRRIP
jgi:histidine triad (HIT) family protein